MPSGHSGLTSEVRARMYFTSESRRALRDHGAEGSADLSQSLSDGMKYGEMRGRLTMSQSSRWKRSDLYRPASGDCTYGRDFTQRSLDNVPLDRDLAQHYAEAGRAGGAFSTGQPLSSATTHRWAFPARAETITRQGSAPPQANLRCTGAGLLETESATRRHFPAPNAELASRFRGELQACLTNSSPLPGPCIAGPTCSAYARHFSSPNQEFTGCPLKRAVKPRASYHVP